jgi:hypothetical protein
LRTQIEALTQQATTEPPPEVAQDHPKSDLDPVPCSGGGAEPVPCP